MAGAWPSRSVASVLTVPQAEALWRRARQFGFGSGGRFDAGGGAVHLWSRPPGAGAAVPTGRAHVLWHHPVRGRVTFHKIEWDPEYGGSEDEVWTALELLSGGAVRRP